MFNVLFQTAVQVSVDMNDQAILVDLLNVLCLKQYVYLSTYNFLNPFTPTSDQDRISPYNVNTISSRQVMRIEKNINHGIISWSNTKFSELTS